MRDILFRGKRTDNNDWVYGSYCNVNDRCYISSGISILEREIINEYEFENENEEPLFDDGLKLGMFLGVTPCTIGQLLHTEKNGRRWFEGDICKINVYVKPYLDYGGDIVNDGFEGYHIGVVCFDIKHGLCIKNYKTYCLESEEVVSEGKFKTITLSRAEIIGNIYEE